MSHAFNRCLEIWVVVMMSRRSAAIVHNTNIHASLLDTGVSTHSASLAVKATALCLVLLHHASIIYLQLAKIAAGGQKLLYIVGMHCRLENTI